MDLTPYVESLREDVLAAAEAAGGEAREMAERLLGPLESAARLTLLSALSAAAAEITGDLAPGSVDLRLRGLDPSFVVTAPPVPTEDAGLQSWAEAGRSPSDADDEVMTRINLRLSQELKDRVEDAARAAGLSVNAWLVRSAVAALGWGGGSAPQHRRQAQGGAHFTGWVR